MALQYRSGVDSLGQSILKDHTRLHHVWTEHNDRFFARIDEYGGWPLGKQYVVFAHSDERHCEFSDIEVNTGWWTTICHADEYYWWKISDTRKAAIRENMRRAFARQIEGIA